MKSRLPSIGSDHTNRGTSTLVSPFLGSDRSALLVTALFIFSVLSIPKFNLPGVIAFGAFPLFLMSAAKIPAGMVIKRLLQISPFVLFMAAGNLLLDRSPVMRIFGVTLSGGMISGTVIVAKTIISLAGLLSVTLCIPFYRICRALEAFHVPDVLVTQLMLLYRYSSVLQEEALSMQKARDLRSFGRKGKEFANTASLVGSLLLRTVNRAERLYRGMTARGFQGHRSTLHDEKIKPVDRITIVLWSLIFLALRLIF
jgi:cobalt/nickel transport system permease protein